MEFEYDPRAERPAVFYRESGLAFKAKQDGKRAEVVRGFGDDRRLASIWNACLRLPGGGVEILWNAAKHFKPGQIVELR